MDSILWNSRRTVPVVQNICTPIIWLQIPDETRRNTNLTRDDIERITWCFSSHKSLINLSFLSSFGASSRSCYLLCKLQSHTVSIANHQWLSSSLATLQSEQIISGNLKSLTQYRRRRPHQNVAVSIQVTQNWNQNVVPCNDYEGITIRKSLQHQSKNIRNFLHSVNVLTNNLLATSV